MKWVALDSVKKKKEKKKNWVEMFKSLRNPDIRKRSFSPDVNKQ